jgi:hypothetical protein
LDDGVSEINDSDEPEITLDTIALPDGKTFKVMMKEFQATVEGDMEEKTQIFVSGVMITELVITEGMTLAQLRDAVTSLIQNPFNFVFEGEPLPVEDEEGFDAIAIKVD